jgi:outer membrane protein TolC
MKKLVCLLWALALFGAQASAELLTIDDYLQKVKAEHKELKALEYNIEALKSKMFEAKRIYSPYFAANYTYKDDESQRPLIQPLDEVSGHMFDASVTQMFNTGTTVSIGFNYSELNNDYPSTRTDVYDYTSTDMYPYIKLEQSLWREIFSGSTKAGVSKIQAQMRSQMYLLIYKRQQLMLNANLAYWGLSYSRTLLDYRNTSLKRNKTILDWNQKRYKLDLVNKVDYLQSQAAYKQREYNLKLAKEQLLKAGRDFNNFLDIVSSEVKYKTSSVVDASKKYLELKDDIEKLGMRADVLSAMADAESAEYAATEAEGIGAELKAVGSYSLNGVDKTYSGAFDHVFEANRPSYTIGATYSLPLDFIKRSKITKGYKLASSGAKQTVEGLVISESNEWQNLFDNWKFAKDRLKLSMEIHETQKQRNVESKQMLTKGRLTTYEALQSEQDLDDASVAVLSDIFELITIFETNKAFYSGNPEF